MQITVTVVQTAHRARAGRLRTISLSALFTTTNCRKYVGNPTSSSSTYASLRTKAHTPQQDTNSSDLLNSMVKRDQEENQLSGLLSKSKVTSSRSPRWGSQIYSIIGQFFTLSRQLEDQKVLSIEAMTSMNHETSTFNYVGHKHAEFRPSEEGVEWEQSPNPGSGISGVAAAIAYLRARGLANASKNATFYNLLCWVLRHAARDLGFQIVPDGFVRIHDLVSVFQPWGHFEAFAKL